MKLTTITEGIRVEDINAYIMEYVWEDEDEDVGINVLELGAY